jgi:hypothetical protein
MLFAIAGRAVMFACLITVHAQAQTPPAAPPVVPAAPVDAAPPPVIPAPPAAAPNGAAQGWNAGIEVKKTAPGAPAAIVKPNTTVIERTGGDKAGGGSGGAIKLIALLTDNGQQIDQGLVWRVFQNSPDPNGKSKLVVENREASPSLKLAPGDYTINAAFGRANLTRRVSIKAGTPSTEHFVLNAGGLRLSAAIGGKAAPPGTVTYSVFADDHDQYDNRAPVMAGAKPGLIVRLNAGIYRIVSIYGDANARVESDVTVEAGKLTEASVVHTAGKASFKLVNRAGGEALPDTHWTIQTAEGETVKETVGALPSHLLLPGDYVAIAKSAGRIFSRSFSVKEGEMANVEVLMDQNGSPPSGPETAGSAITPGDPQPNLELKIP